MHKPTKVFIADDHQIIVDGIKTMLEATGQVSVLGEANDGLGVIEFLKARDETNQPDILILDINMPILNGVETTKIVRVQYPKIKVLILTMFNEAEFVRNMAKVGAHGFILKNAGREEMLIAIDRLMNGKTYYSEDVTKTLQESNQSKNQANGVALTRRKVEVLKLLADGLTLKEMSEQLFISPHTVETHRKNQLSKTGQKSSAGLIKYALDAKII